jgi:hypothetical protein
MSTVLLQLPSSGDDRQAQGPLYDLKQRQYSTMVSAEEVEEGNVVPSHAPDMGSRFIEVI